MSDLLSIGSSGVAAYQRALSTVSNNIANVGTEGYVRQETSLTETMPRQQGRVYLGTGTAVTAIKRAYDQFLETNLRNSTSELNTQGPMVNYANRVVDILGSETIGLPAALDQFFATSRSLSADPSSTILRQQFLRDGDSLAGRFNELSTQMAGVDTETRESINARVADINTLAGQIATVNKQLSKHPLVDRQPPDLLDQRDLLLTKLSALVKVNVTTRANGAVDLSIGSAVGGARIVDGDKSVPLEARFDEKDLSRVTIVADPYSKTPTEVVGVSSGELGGLLGFREQVLQPTFASLDFLVTTFAGEINAIHRNGIDVEGNVGKDLFQIDQITKTDPASGQSVKIDRPSAGIRLAVDDANKVAAGGLFRVIENAKNLSGADASLSYAADYANPTSVPSLSQVLRNNPDPSAGIAAPRDQLLGQIPMGADNWSLFLDNASDKQNIQVFTRDGRQLLGAPITDDATLRSLITTKNGFVGGSTYSSDYLNKSGETGYKQMSVFYGLMSKPITQYDRATQFTPEHDVLPSTIEHIELTGSTIPANMASIGGNHLTINGRSLPALYPTQPAKTIQASDIAEWMNRAADGLEPAVGVNAMTETPELAVDPAKGLYINGVGIPAQAGRTLADLALQINSQYANETNVVASVNADGTALVLKNTDGYGGNDIRVGEMNDGGALANEKIYRGQLNFGDGFAITIGYGKDGVAGDLDFLGTPKGKYYTGLMPIVPMSASIDGARIPSNVDGIAGNTLTLNGKTLGALDYNRRLKVPDMVGWLNSTGATLEPPVVITGSNELRSPAKSIKDGLDKGLPLQINGVKVAGSGTGGVFTSAEDVAAAINQADTGHVVAAQSSQNLLRKLSINGESITGSGVNGTFATRQDMVDAINAKTADTGVTATIDGSSGEITLSNAGSDKAGEDIVLGPLDEVNALGVAGGTYSKVYAEIDADGSMLVRNGSGADISITTLTGGSNVLGLGNGTYHGQLDLASSDEIRIGFTTEHAEEGAAELAKLGLRTGVYLDGAAKEDLLVFVTEGSGTVAGDFDASMADPAALDEQRINTLRSEKYDITFTSANHYQISWTNPANGLVTRLAERDYDPKAGIEYQGVQLTLNRAPMAGDKYVIDGNQDGTGNNQNMLDIVALQTRGFIGGQGGKTISQAYEEEVGKIGNFSNQATIAQKALQVVNDQAVEARDKVSGVSLDSEAADLIRFQQAYQANAKAMQMANELFDSILQAAR